MSIEQALDGAELAAIPTTLSWVKRRLIGRADQLAEPSGKPCGGGRIYIHDLKAILEGVAAARTSIAGTALCRFDPPGDPPLRFSRAENA
jgi:hypothetical protein